MIGCRFASVSNRRQGFTLAEVMLTLCLLVVIAGLVWPVLDKPFANQRLRKAAEAIRAEWVGARVEAMDSGQTYVFRYAVDGDRFRLERYASAETADSPLFGDLLSDSGDASSYAAGSPVAQQDTLPRGVTFVASQTAPDTRAVMIEWRADSVGAAEAGWSEPILFYPDGTTSTAQLILKNEYDRSIELSLRGLTGTVNVSKVRSAENWLP